MLNMSRYKNGDNNRIIYFYRNMQLLGVKGIIFENIQEVNL